MSLTSAQDTIGIIGVVIVAFSVPIIAILTRHQRHMAEILHRNQSQNDNDQLHQQMAAMQAQITDLRMMVQEHIINNDQSSMTTASVEQRLNQ